MEKAKVLLPVDGMRNSVPAEDYAIELNKKMALEVTVLNVFNTRQVEGRGLNIPLQEMVRESHESYMSKILDEVVDKLKKGGVEATLRLMSGDPGTVICNLAVDEKFRLRAHLRQRPHRIPGLAGRIGHQPCSLPLFETGHSGEAHA